VQTISVYYNVPSSVPKQHTEWTNHYLQIKYSWVGTKFPVIQTAGCTVDNLFIVKCPVCVHEGWYGTGQRWRYSD